MTFISNKLFFTVLGLIIFTILTTVLVIQYINEKNIHIFGIIVSAAINVLLFITIVFNNKINTCIQGTSKIGGVGESDDDDEKTDDFIDITDDFIDTPDVSIPMDPKTTDLEKLQSIIKDKIKDKVKDSPLFNNFFNSPLYDASLYKEIKAYTFSNTITGFESKEELSSLKNNTVLYVTKTGQKYNSAFAALFPKLIELHCFYGIFNRDSDFSLFTNLQKLYLESVVAHRGFIAFSDENIEQLRQLENLKVLSLGKNVVTRQLRGNNIPLLTNLEELICHYGRSGINFIDLKPLKKLKKINGLKCIRWNSY